MRIVIAIIILAVAPCADFVTTLQAATPPAQSTYQSSGAPNPDDARRVVMNLGVGRYVEVTLSSGEIERGYIRTIADDHFALLVDGMPAPADIAYGDLRQVRPIPQLVLRSTRSSLKRNVIVGIVVLGLAFLSYTVQGCSHTSAC